MTEQRPVASIPPTLPPPPSPRTASYVFTGAVDVVLISARDVKL